MTFDEVIQKVQSIYSKGVQSDDSRLTNRHIYSELRSTRNVILSQQIRKKQKLSQWSYQTIPCMEMVTASIHDCPCIPLEGCKILKSKHKLPAIFTDNDKHLIQSVTSIDGSLKLYETTWENVRDQRGDKFGGFIPEFFIFNNYLFITNRKVLDAITFTALFVNPIDAYVFPSYCEDVVCFNYLDFDFPIDGKLETAVIDITSEKLIGSFSYAHQDLSNNAKDDVISSPRRRSRNREDGQEYDYE